MSTSNVPESRQLMINLMYLVLTALLALNVTREVLDAFNTMNTSIQRSNHSINIKSQQMYEAFNKAEATSDSLKVRPWNDKAKAIKAKTEDLMTYLSGWKDTLVRKSGGYELGDHGDSVMKGMDDINVPTDVFVTKKNGEALKQHLEDYINFVLSEIDSPAVRNEMAKQFPLQIKDPEKSEDNPSGDWAYGTFHNIPVVAGVAMLSKFQNDIKNSESMVLDYLMKQIHAQDYKFNTLQAIAVPNTTYALEGQPISATIMLAAYNKNATNMRISSSAGNVPVKDGVGTLEFKASGVGTRTVNGTIYIDKEGTAESYPFKFDYTVGTAGASLQLDKMNVMYIGVDNPVTLSASGYNIEDVSLNMPGATLKSDGKGKYLVRVTKQGTMKYTINARTRSGGSAQVGGGEIRVKYIPPPEGEVAGTASGLVATNVAKAQIGVVAELKNFDFEARFIVQSFHFVWLAQNGQVRDAQNNSALFNETTKTLMKQSRPGDRWIFEDVRAKGPDGRIQKINSVTITLN